MASPKQPFFSAISDTVSILLFWVSSLGRLFYHCGPGHWPLWGNPVLAFLKFSPSGRSKATFQGTVRFFFSYVFYRIFTWPRMSILVSYRAEAWKGLSFSAPGAELRLEPGSPDPLTGPFSWPPWLGWSCSAFQIFVYLDVSKGEARSFQETSVWVIGGLRPLLQKPLRRHL